MSVFGSSKRSDNINTSCQKGGFLLKLPFRKQMGKWQRRWFVCKDGYMLYYGSKKLRNGATQFDVHPKGVIPLGNTTVEWYVASTG